MNDKRTNKSYVHKIIYPAKGNWQYFFGKLFKILIIEIKMNKYEKSERRNAYTKDEVGAGNKKTTKCNKRIR